MPLSEFGTPQMQSWRDLAPAATSLATGPGSGAGSAASRYCPTNS